MDTFNLDTQPTIHRYTSPDGAACLAVDGPKGHVLVTPTSGQPSWNVWFSDSLAILSTWTQRDRALIAAMRAAGCEL